MKRAAIGLFAILIIAAFVVLLWRSRAPTAPATPRDGLDPAVVELMDQGRAEVKRSRRSPEAWGKLGMILKASAFNVEALESFRQAEKLNHTDARWPYFQATLLFPARAQEALAKMRRAAQMHPQEFVRLRLGQMLTEAGALSEAEQVFAKILSASHGHPGAHLGMAQICHAQNKSRAAIEHLKYSLQDEHTAKSATVLLAAVQFRLGQTQAAQESARRAASLPPDLPWPDPFEAEAAKYQAGLRPLIEECQRLLGANRLNEALALIDRLLAGYPRAAEGWLYLGRARLMQNDLPAAEKALTTHLQLDPASFDGHMQFGLVFHRQGRLGEALAQFQKAVASKPDSETAHYFAGIVHLQQQNTNAALQSFRAALRYQPDYAPAQKALADVLGK